jgi:hypothetical protein
VAGKTEKTENTDQRPPVVDDAAIKESFADDFVGLYGVGPNFHLTFATRRPVRNPPGVARFVSSRVVLPLEAAMELYGALHNAVANLESRGVVKRRQVPAKTEKD